MLWWLLLILRVRLLELRGRRLLLGLLELLLLDVEPLLERLGQLLVALPLQAKFKIHFTFCGFKSYVLTLKHVSRVSCPFQGWVKT